MSGWDVAGIIIAVFWAVLVCFLAYTLIHVVKVLQETTTLLANVTDQTVPLLGEVRTTVSTTNAQLAKVDTISDNVATISDNAAAMATLVTATVGGPLVRAASFAYGVRKAMKERQKADVETRVRKAMKEEKQAMKEVQRASHRRVAR